MPDNQPTKAPTARIVTMILCYVVVLVAAWPLTAYVSVGNWLGFAAVFAFQLAVMGVLAVAARSIRRSFSDV